MAHVRRRDGTFTKERNSLPSEMNTSAKRPRVTYESIRHIKDLGRLIHQEYPHIRVPEGVFIASIIFRAIEQSLLGQCKKPKKRRAIHIPYFGTFYARSIAPQHIKNLKFGDTDMPARYRLSWKAVPSLRKKLLNLPVLPDEAGEFNYSHTSKRRKKKAV